MLKLRGLVGRALPLWRNVTWGLFSTPRMQHISQEKNSPYTLLDTFPKGAPMPHAAATALSSGSATVVADMGLPQPRAPAPLPLSHPVPSPPSPPSPPPAAARSGLFPTHQAAHKALATVDASASLLDALRVMSAMNTSTVLVTENMKMFSHGGGRRQELKGVIHFHQFLNLRWKDFLSGQTLPTCATVMSPSLTWLNAASSVNESFSRLLNQVPLGRIDNCIVLKDHSFITTTGGLVESTKGGLIPKRPIWLDCVVGVIDVKTLILSVLKESEIRLENMSQYVRSLGELRSDRDGACTTTPPSASATASKATSTWEHGGAALRSDTQDWAKCVHKISAERSGAAAASARDTRDTSCSPTDLSVSAACVYACPSLRDIMQLNQEKQVRREQAMDAGTEQQTDLKKESKAMYAATRSILELSEQAMQESLWFTSAATAGKEFANNVGAVIKAPEEIAQSTSSTFFSPAEGAVAVSGAVIAAGKEADATKKEALRFACPLPSSAHVPSQSVQAAPPSVFAGDTLTEALDMLAERTNSVVFVRKNRDRCGGTAIDADVGATGAADPATAPATASDAYVRNEDYVGVVTESDVIDRLIVVLEKKALDPSVDISKEMHSTRVGTVMRPVKLHLAASTHLVEALTMMVQHGKEHACLVVEDNTAATTTSSRSSESPSTTTRTDGGADAHAKKILGIVTLNDLFKAALVEIKSKSSALTAYLVGDVKYPG